MGEQLDKMHEFVESGESETLSAFWDWLMANGFRFTRWEQRTERLPCSEIRCVDGQITVPNPNPLVGWTTENLPEEIQETCRRCDGAGFLIKYHPEEWTMWHSGPEQLFALYAGIDLDKLEQERREILEELRRHNAAAKEKST